MRPQSSEIPAIGQIRALVLEDLSRVGIDASSEAVQVTVAGLKKPNLFSTRPGCAVTVQFTDRLSRPRSVGLWVKQVGRADDAFAAMDTAYRLLENANLQAPVPKPFFFDRATGLIFMERIEGETLLRRVLKDSMWRGKFSYPDCRRTLGSIGKWLSKFHNVSSDGSTTNIVSMIPEIESSLSENIHFGAKEKVRLGKELEWASKSPIAHLEFPVVTPHNGLMTRNILVDSTEFHIVQWDAMVYRHVPRPAICWWDLTTLIMSIESLLRFHPVVSKGRLEELCNALWEGYVDGIMAPSISLEEFRSVIMFPMVLRYYTGLGGNQPVYSMYRKHLGWRYVRALRSKLLSGRGSLF